MLHLFEPDIPIRSATPSNADISGIINEDISRKWQAFEWRPETIDARARDVQSIIPHPSLSPQKPSEMHGNL